MPNVQKIYMRHKTQLFQIYNLCSKFFLDIVNT
jgi:hypothetical protein